MGTVTSRFWSAPDTGDPTEIILLRHGATALTADRRFSGAGGDDPALSEEGQEQAAAVALALGRAARFDAVLTSPLRRAHQTADVAARALGLSVVVDEGWTECAFGDWDGLTDAEVVQRWPVEHAAWMGSTTSAPPGGESFDEVQLRVVLARDRVLVQHARQRVLVVTHVTPIKQLARLALDAGPQVLWHLQSSPASITVTRWWPDGGATLASFNETSHLQP